MVTPCLWAPRAQASPPPPADFSPQTLRLRSKLKCPFRLPFPSPEPSTPPWHLPLGLAGSCCCCCYGVSRIESWDGCGLCFPGCLSLGGPTFVTGTTGDSLTIRCRYEKDYKGYNKYWCRGQHDTDCNKIVETRGTEREERNGRVSIRDDADDLTLTVTMKNLNAADAGSYWCKIQTVWILDEWSRDPSFQVQVSVSPGKSPPCSNSRPHGISD